MSYSASEVANLCHARTEAVEAVQKLQRRCDDLEDLLRSAHCIADRKGEDTAWETFSARIASFGIGPVTAKVFKNPRE